MLLYVDDFTIAQVSGDICGPKKTGALRRIEGDQYGLCRPAPVFRAQRTSRSTRTPAVRIWILLSHKACVTCAVESSRLVQEPHSFYADGVSCYTGPQKCCGQQRLERGSLRVGPHNSCCSAYSRQPSVCLLGVGNESRIESIPVSRISENP